MSRANGLPDRLWRQMQAGPRPTMTDVVAALNHAATYTVASADRALDALDGIAGAVSRKIALRPYHERVGAVTAKCQRAEGRAV